VKHETSHFGGCLVNFALVLLLAPLRFRCWWDTSSLFTLWRDSSRKTTFDDAEKIGMQYVGG
jgi:hypothetical protein